MCYTSKNTNFQKILKFLSDNKFCFFRCIGSFEMLFYFAVHFVWCKKKFTKKFFFWFLVLFALVIYLSLYFVENARVLFLYYTVYPAPVTIILLILYTEKYRVLHFAVTYCRLDPFKFKKKKQNKWS
jgi:hypothetical protein